MMSANDVVRARIDAGVGGGGGSSCHNGTDRLRRVPPDDDAYCRRQGAALRAFGSNVEATIAAMKAARRGDSVTVGSPSRLIASLNADD